MLNSVELRDAISKATARAKEIVELCKTEVREMTEEEENEFKSLREEIDNKKAELKELEEKLRSYEEELPADEEEDEKEENNETRNKSNKNTMKKQSLIKEIRNAIDNNVKSFPLYANSVLSQLGARWYTGLPKGDVQIPIMGAGQCGWAGEVAAASATANTFTTVLLQPKRLTAYVDISKQLIAQDTIGVEAAIRRDIVNALNDKLEATIFGDAQGSATQPAGLFYNVTPEEITDYAGLCTFEAELDDANINGQKKYLMGNSAKATFRSMIKGTNATGMVMENNQIDGTPMLNTSNVASTEFVYGDFNYLAVASWGDIEITVDQYTQAVNGCIRLVVNAYFDAKVLRSEAFVFGTVDAGE